MPCQTRSEEQLSQSLQILQKVQVEIPIKEFIQFLYIALGAASEVETQLIIAHRLKYIMSIEKELEELTRIRKMLNSLITAIKGKIQQ